MKVTKSSFGNIYFKYYEVEVLQKEVVITQRLDLSQMKRCNLVSLSILTLALPVVCVQLVRSVKWEKMEEVSEVLK